MTMRRAILQGLSFSGLLMTVVPSALVFAGVLDWGTHVTFMLMGAALYFATAPAWINKEATGRA